MKNVLVLASCVLAASAAQSAELPAERLQALEAWQRARGAEWQLHADELVESSLFLYGGAAEPGFTPRADGDYFVLAREFLAETHGLHRVDPGTLVEDRVTFLPLGAQGSSDKLAVRLIQQVGGVPVLGGSVHLLFDTAGRLLSLDVLALPDLAGFPVAPTVTEPAARGLAAKLFERDAGVPPTHLEPGRLAIARLSEGGALQPRLVWEVNAQWLVEDFEAEGWRYRLDAENGELVQREESVHHLDVSGRVTSQVSSGHEPYYATNSVSADMPYITVTSPQGDAVTDFDGNFTIVGATAPVDVTIAYDGTYADAVNIATGVDYSITTTLNAASGNVVLMNAAETEDDTAEANAFQWIAMMREWTATVNPADPVWNGFKALANCNFNFSCNASFSGNAINLYRSGGSCPNTSYSSIVVHEMGHWMNELYGNGQGNAGFGEGNSDVFSLYILDDPIVGLDFFGPGNHLRDANNSNLWCNNSNAPNCYFQNHENGEMLMGALWKVRANLKNTHGAAAGSALANTLFNAWMIAYDDALITPLIELHWLVLDDDDGNFSNGSPNYADIDGGFLQQAFPGLPLPATYCTAGTSASGCQATLSAYGIPSSTSTSGFSLLATGVEGGKDGLFFFGTSGQQANPWGTGTSYQCVVPPVARMGLLAGSGTNGTCEGAFAQDLNALWCPSCPKPNLNPGVAAIVQAQLWYRDPQNTSSQTTSLSNAIEFQVLK